MPKVVHTIIADTAKAIAQEAYDAIAHDNAFYAEWPSADLFVTHNWRMFTDQARQALLRMLEVDHWEAGVPVYKYPEAMREPVYEALLIDGPQMAMNRDQRRAQHAKTRNVH